MIVDNASDFRAALTRMPFEPRRAHSAGAVFMVQPEGFRLAEDSATDNTYMDLSLAVDPERALAQHRALAQAIRMAGIPVVLFPGDAATPDAVFPNNVFATAPGRLVVGRMKHPVRQREAAREDIRRFFREQLGRTEHDLSAQAAVCELTGPLIIDRARGIGFCGMSERVEPEGARLMHAALDLRLSYCFALVPGEYHTNVVMSVLAGRTLVLHRASVARAEDADAIAGAFDGRVLWLSDEEKSAFVGNCIALSERDLFMTRTGERALRAESRAFLREQGFVLHTVELDEIEKAGGSLRCCVGEIY